MGSKGNRRGLPPALKNYKAEIARLHREGVGPSRISAQLGVSLPTVYRWRDYNAESEEGATESGKRRRGTSLSKEKEAEVVERALEYRKNHNGDLNINALSKTLEISYGIVRRTLLKHEISAEEPDVSIVEEAVVPTQGMISRISGYSQSTVSRVLKNDTRVSDEIRREIEAVAAKLGYRANPELSSLSRSRWRGRKLSLKFAYLAIGEQNVPALPDDRHLFTALSLQAAKRGCLLELCNPLDYPNAKRMTQVLYHRGVQGIILGVQLLNPFTVPLFKEDVWSEFSLLGCGNANTSFLNHVTFAQIELALRSSLKLAQDYGYQRICYFYLPEANQINVFPKWNSGYVLGLMRHLQSIFLAPHNRIPNLLFEDLGTDYEHKTIKDYIAEYQPELILSNSNRGYEIVKKIRGRKKPAYISLDRGTNPKGNIAGLVLSDWNDYASELLKALSEQINHNQFGLPIAPQKREVKYKRWVEGKSLPRKKIGKSKLEWIVPKTAVDREPQMKARAEYLDLRGVVNRSSLIPGQWFASATMSLPSQPLSLNGLCFWPIADRENNVLIMRSSLHQQAASPELYPERVVISINRKIKACSFLHTSGYTVGLQTFASYLFRYADGSTHLIPIIGASSQYSNTCPSSDWKLAESELGSNTSEPLSYRYAPRANIGDWNAYYTVGTNQLASGARAIIVNDAAAGFYCYLFTLRWENPMPNKEIVSLEITSSAESKSTLAVLAATLEL